MTKQSYLCFSSSSTTGFRTFNSVPPTPSSLCRRSYLKTKANSSSIKTRNGEMGDAGDSVKQEKKVVFVTVGTTLFDALVRAVDTNGVKQELLRKGYTHLVIQMGRGSYNPTKCNGEEGSLAVDYFTFSPSIADHLRSASLGLGAYLKLCSLVNL
uniref:Glycosyl transferase family 28 C-terminal domain-containing protein n=1 Tax=Salix viminalis TaxID=40686 RepID=A0A6N2M874_SALVM